MLLFSNRKGLFARRTHAERFSNGDENGIRLDVENFYVFPVTVEIVDEIPHQFQRRDVLFKTTIKAGTKAVINYTLRPVKRGSYNFGTVNVFVLGTIDY